MRIQSKKRAYATTYQSQNQFVLKVLSPHLIKNYIRETVDQISENIYMQYFLGFTSFSNEPPFDPSLFVEFRKRVGMDQVNAINEKIAKLNADFESIKNT